MYKEENRHSGQAGLQEEDFNKEDFRREEMMVRHYFVNKHISPSAEQVQRELERFHAQRTAATRSKSVPMLLSFLSGAAAVLLFMFFFYGESLFTPQDTPVAVFLANNDMENVTLQRAGGEFLVIDEQSDKQQLEELGANLDDDSQQLTYNTASAPKEIFTQTLTTPRQKMFHIVLSDGTKVWLNADSQLSYPNHFTGKERVVTLRGEAFFEVAKNEACPFVVQTEQLSTKVLGTEFNVRNYSAGDTHVTLLTGSVEVRNTDLSQKALIRPGEDAHLTADKDFQVKAVDTDAYCLWRTGAFYFDNVTMLEVAKELGRWYNVDVVFNNRHAMSIKVHFLADRNGTLQQAVDLLNSLKKTNANIVDERLVID